MWSRELIRTFTDRMDNAAEMDYASRALPHSHGRVATENATMPASDRSKAEPIQFSSFPLSSQLLRNRRWLREPYTLAQEMEYGLIEML